ncbi:MAG: alpha/beta fold hydrolase [Bacteroidales bacterium]
MKRWGHIGMLLAGLLLLSGRVVSGQDTLVYLFPGQGSDERLFKHLELPPGYDTVHISYPVPDKDEDLHTYALRFMNRIDTTSPFVLIGVSLGGMICTELTDTLSPVRTILISSAKTGEELPGRYTFLKQFPIDRVIPAGVIKASARVLQGIVEPDRKNDPETFKSMLKEKDPHYLKRTSEMIALWNRSAYPEGIVHIHGNKDHTIPVKNVKADYIVEGGSHMMMVTRAGEINAIIQKILTVQAS